MKTIVWDLDDVLNQHQAVWFLANHQRFNHGLEYADLTTNPPCKLLGLSLEEYYRSIDEFRLSPAAAAMKPQEEVLSWFQNWGPRFHHIVLTARPRDTAAPAAEWVFRHFGEWVSHFAVVPSPRGNDQGQLTKATFIATHFKEVDFFIDDHTANVAEVAQLGIRSFLFPQPWNKSPWSVAEILTALASAVQVKEENPAYVS